MTTTEPSRRSAAVRGRPGALLIRPEDPRPGDHLDRLFELSLDMLGTISFAGFFTLLNPAWELALGWTREELMAEPFAFFVHPDDLDRTMATATAVTAPGASAVVDFENRYRCRDGSYRWLSWTLVPADEAMFFVARDITVRKSEAIDRDHADSLRTAIADNIADGVYVVDATGALSFINPAGMRLLDFDSIDEVLGRTPHALFHHSHLDGSRYRIEDCPLPRVRIDGRSVHVFEDTFWRKDGSALPVAYSSASIELDDGLGSVVAFRDITATHIERERVRVEFGEVAWFEEVRQALEKNRLVLYGQPIVDVRTGETVKHELLIRMLSLTGEVIGPAEFLPAVEKFGLMQEIDRWVFSRAAELAATGRAVAVNLSAASVGDPEVLLHIEQEIARTGAMPQRLTFEVTETSVMKDLQDGRRFADRLVGLGCLFALDDFGTGYGSLTYLRQLPIAYLKIDVEFIRNMVRNEADRALVKTVVSIAKSLGKKTIAEGVEDKETFDLLAELGIDFGQGYYLGRPHALSVA